MTPEDQDEVEFMQSNFADSCFAEEIDIDSIPMELFEELIQSAEND